MKRFSVHASILAAVFALCSLTASAQSHYTDAGATSKLSLGIGAAGGFSLPTADLSGAEKAPGFAYRIGVNASYPASDEVTAFLNFGLDQRKFGFKPSGNLDSYFTNIGYFFIQPGISYSSLGLSLNLGLPVSASATNPFDPPSTIDVSTDELAMMVEPRLNGTLVLMDEAKYWLGLDISFGFMVNKLLQDDYITPGTVSDGNGISAHLGLTFQFGLLET